MPRHAVLYTLYYLHTHTYKHIHTERGESSKLRCGFVPLMNLQRDSIESPFTYMYVINTTYYIPWGHVEHPKTVTSYTSPNANVTRVNEYPEEPQSTQYP